MMRFISLGFAVKASIRHRSANLQCICRCNRRHREFHHRSSPTGWPAPLHYRTLLTIASMAELLLQQTCLIFIKKSSMYRTGKSYVYIIKIHSNSFTNIVMWSSINYVSLIWTNNDIAVALCICSVTNKHTTQSVKNIRVLQFVRSESWRCVS